MNDGRRISAPVTVGDIREVTGSAAGSLSALCTHVNVYSRFKPYRFGDVDAHRRFSHSEWLAYCRANNWGMTPRRLEWPDTGSVGEGIMPDLVPLWGQPLPVAGEPIRLGDFEGYDHAAAAPALRCFIGDFSDLSREPVSDRDLQLAAGNRPALARPRGGDDGLSGQFAWWLYREGGAYDLNLADFTVPGSTVTFAQCRPTLVVACDSLAIITQDTHSLDTPHVNPEWDEQHPLEPLYVDGTHLAAFNWAKVDPAPFVRAGYFILMAGLLPEHPEANTRHTGSDPYNTVPLAEAVRTATPYSCLVWPDYQQQEVLQSQVFTFPIDL